MSYSKSASNSVTSGEASGVNHPRPVAMVQLGCLIIRHLV
jgi:hypothetical protein